MGFFTETIIHDMSLFYQNTSVTLSQDTPHHHTHTNSLFPGPLLSPFASSSCILPSAGIPGIWITQPAQSLSICCSLSLLEPFPQSENKPAPIYSSRFPLLCNLSQARFPSYYHPKGCLPSSQQPLTASGAFFCSVALRWSRMFSYFLTCICIIYHLSHHHYHPLHQCDFGL